MMRRHVSQQPLYLKKDGEYVEVMPMIYCPFCGGHIGEEEESSDESEPNSNPEDVKYITHPRRSRRIVLN